MSLSMAGYLEIQLYTFAEICLTSLEICCGISLHQPLYFFSDNTTFALIFPLKTNTSHLRFTFNL